VNRQLVAGQQVRIELDVQARDRHARLLAYVYVGTQMVNAELVRRAYAQLMTVPPNVAHQEMFVKAPAGGPGTEARVVGCSVRADHATGNRFPG
jgi:endonuclease YncB( thermonuclease family)